MAVMSGAARVRAPHAASALSAEFANVYRLFSFFLIALFLRFAFSVAPYAAEVSAVHLDAVRALFFAAVVAGELFNHNG